MYIYQSHNSVPQIVIKATAGSKEQKELEKVKKTFEELYRESKAEKTPLRAVKYHIL
ncbi:MAG: hypothetical protein IJB74_05460 [Clostridia bacterium]|nr:hypothetical protein [Clostridia bacterium]